MSLCQRPRWHLFNPSNLKAAVPVTAPCEGGWGVWGVIYSRTQLVAKLSCCARPWGAMFTVWLACRCHYSCLWQRGQRAGRWGGAGWWGGGERMTNGASWRWLLWWHQTDFRCGGLLWLSLLPATTPSGWPWRCWDRWGSGNSALKETQTLLVPYSIAYLCSKPDLWFNNGLLQFKFRPTLLWFHFKDKRFHSSNDHRNQSCSF